MKIDVQRGNRNREAQARANRTHVKAFLAAVRYNGDEMPEPADAHAMRPHVFGDGR